MGEIKLFRFSGQDSLELVPRLAQMERGLRLLMEKHLEGFLGIRLLAHEYRIGRQQRGASDSLGLDENNCPVILEYKRHNDDNIICQGLYYLNWLLEHGHPRACFHNAMKCRCEKDHAQKTRFLAHSRRWRRAGLRIRRQKLSENSF